MSSPVPASRFEATDLDDMQGLILSGYGHLYFSEYLLLRFEDPAAAKQWIGQIAEEVTTGCWDSDETGNAIKPPRALNVALTSMGLTALGLDVASASFSEEFIEGMAEQHRSRRLGDTGPSDPKYWEFGGPGSAIHALLILQAQTKPELEDDVQEQRKRASEFEVKEVAPSIAGFMSRDSREHFGYVDSISQPNIEGSPAHRKDHTPDVKAGEFVLGYPNEYGHLPPSPTCPGTSSSDRRDLGRNGSYLVFRKLHQDVAGFRQFLSKVSADAGRRESIRAKLVGRWPSGAPLVLAPLGDDPSKGKENDFGYAATDPDGMGCPIAAHIRRANPRDSLGEDPQESQNKVNRHRILRRGALFGERLPDDAMMDDGVDRGILFIAIGADIRRQFEFVQQTWINNPKFGGLYSDSDPLVGLSGSGDPCTFTIPSTGTREQLQDLPDFVRVRGGAYFFLPSASALRFVATSDPTHLVRLDPAPSTQAAVKGMSAFFVATAGEFGALYFWLLFTNRGNLPVALLALLAGFIVERSAVVWWLGLPSQIKLVSGKSMPLWLILVSVTVAEMVVWVGFLEVSKGFGLALAALPFFLLIHLIHCSESAVITKDTFIRQIISLGPIILSAIETLTAVLWLHFTLDGSPLQGSAALLIGLLLEHTLQGVGLARGKAMHPTAAARP